MLDFSWTELLVIVVLGVLILGPKELPNIMYGLGKLFRRLQYMRYALSNQFENFMQETELRQDPLKNPAKDAPAQDTQNSQKITDPIEEDEEEFIETELSFLKDLRTKDDLKGFD